MNRNEKTLTQWRQNWKFFLWKIQSINRVPYCESNFCRFVRADLAAAPVYIPDKEMYFFFIPKIVSYTEAQRHCHKLGSSWRIPAVEELEHVSPFFGYSTHVKNKIPCPTAVWAIKDKKAVIVYLSPFSNKLICEDLSIFKMKSKANIISVFPS
ncbi:hypothetical protein [Alteribacillus sp. HJP-4]|uniref:hypothetical protein n=1 Tax=Alteribacillus sp. HJP-4 TaxID=2775394 RepID=UPI0035CD098C